MAFESWETFKESMIVYTVLSPVTYVTLVALGLAFSYVVSVMLGPSRQPQHQRSSVYEERLVKDMNEVPMDTTSSQLTVPSSPLWDVFLSFYGKDTRRSFISNLYYALDQAGIVTFRDDPALEKGEEISSGLRQAIKNSKMFVVVISENYARSSWCLDELVEILSSKRTKNQIIPVFYYVHPSDLRHHKGSFGRALQRHKKRYSFDRIEKWKSALTEIAKLSGYHLEDAKESEADTIQNIVQIVLSQASTKVLHLDRYLFGIDFAVEKIYQQLSMESNDVRALGICGMGGIGKTTIAKAFYNKYSHKFDISCFVENVKQNSQGGSPLLPLLQQLLIQLLRKKDFKVRDVESALRTLKAILSSKKALVFLDDLDQSSYSELLVRICKLFSDGSRVIITTRDANLLNQLKVKMSNVDIYMVKHLNHIDSLELFSYHAFEKPKPPRGYVTLSQSFVTYAAGLPLALKVLGSSMCGSTDLSFWKAKLEKVKKIPMNDIVKILQLSYDELADEMEKAIFLDIVFFFVGKNRDEAIHVFNSCGYFPDAGIPVLVKRYLLTIDEDNNLQMHNLIQDMGRKVIHEESKHGKCQRLYLDQEEACQALQNLEERDKIEGLIIDLRRSTNKYCNAEIFERLPNLRLLKLVDVHGIKGNLKTSFHELRCISWHGCPWTHLPSAIHLQKLVSFDMPFSRFKTLWKDAKLPCLRHLNLEGSKYLKEVPESIGQLTTLDHFTVRDCVTLKRLPKRIIQLSTLGCLNMSGCRNLKLLPEQVGNMKGLQILDASQTAIEILPVSIAHLKKLVYLNVSSCNKLRKLPEQFGNIEGLEKFNAYKSAIEQLPDSFSNLLNLVDLNLRSCSQLKRLPEQLGKMQCLEKLDASFSAIEELPDSIGRLRRIQRLRFNYCEKLTYVPNSILNLTSLIELYLNRVDNIKIELSDAVNYRKLKNLELSCNIRDWLPVIQSFTSLKVLSLYDECGSLSPTKPFSFFMLFNLESLSLINCTSHGSSFPELPLNLEILRVHNHASLEQVPDLSNLKQLKDMAISRCCSLQSLQKLPPQLSSLTVKDCTSLQDLPDLSMLRDLERLNVARNGSTLKVSLNESNLQVRREEFSATLENREIAEWFNYKNSGCTVSFDVPPNFVGVAFWVVYKCLYKGYSIVEAVVTNKTEGMTRRYYIWSDASSRVGDVQSTVKCIRRDDIPIKSGDKIMVSFRMVDGAFPRFINEEMKRAVKMCGAHMILERPYSIL